MVGFKKGGKQRQRTIFAVQREATCSPLSLPKPRGKQKERQLLKDKGKGGKKGARVEISFSGKGGGERLHLVCLSCMRGKKKKLGIVSSLKKKKGCDQWPRISCRGGEEGKGEGRRRRQCSAFFKKSRRKGGDGVTWSLPTKKNGKKKKSSVCLCKVEKGERGTDSSDGEKSYAGRKKGKHRPLLH